jgi:hypothetical protein
MCPTLGNLWVIRPHEFALLLRLERHTSILYRVVLPQQQPQHLLDNIIVQQQHYVTTLVERPAFRIRVEHRFVAIIAVVKKLLPQPVYRRLVTLQMLLVKLGAVLGQLQSHRFG